MKLVDLDGEGEITKQNVREFFSLPDFMLRLNATQNNRDSLRPQFDQAPVGRTSINDEQTIPSGSIDTAEEIDLMFEDETIREPS